MQESAHRTIWRKRVGELLDSGLSVKSWCAINEISYRMMYRWLTTFKDQEPEVLGGYEIAHAGDGQNHWVECVMRARADRCTPDAGRREYQVGFATVELAECMGPVQEPGPCAQAPITITSGPVTVLIGNGADEGLVRMVIKGVCAR